ncbi:hypothetical protein EQV77_12935 [Halobacillus fulvus]|nr:hypothetical protein EQV77_12935 [Halobacillus fulvus]
MNPLKTCHECSYIYDRLKQQEETIAQLVQIIASTNRKVVELHNLQRPIRHELLPEKPPILTSKQSSSF